MAMAQRYHIIDKDHYSEDEYFEFERISIGRWEYVNGQIRAMSGGTANHGTIASNLIRVIGNALVSKDCRVFGSDMKVHTADGINTFPDISVVCGHLHFYQGRTDILTNPLLIVEILSDSTEAYDRGDKFRHYQTMQTLTDYMLASQSEARVALFTGSTDFWQSQEVTDLSGAVYLPSIDTTVALADIYALIDWE